MESLQLAQMLADLSSLNAAEPNAAAALVTANKAIEKVEAESRTNLAVPGRPELQRPHSSQNVPRPSASAATAPSGTGTGANTPSSAAAYARFDKFGRRMMMSPPLSRTNSAQGSAPGTPRRGGESETEDELDRASTLMALYEIRSKLKQQDNTSLMKAREKVAQLAARQQAVNTARQKEAEKSRPKYTYPK